MTIEKIIDYFEQEGIRCRQDGETVIFMLENIDDNENWRVIGQAAIARYNEEGDNILNLHFNVAQKAKREIYEKIATKLMELNRMSVFGCLYMDAVDMIRYEVNLPLVKAEKSDMMKQFDFVFGQMRNFIEAYYAYILVMINEPDKLELDRYIELIMDEEPDENEE